MRRLSFAQRTESEHPKEILRKEEENPLKIEQNAPKDRFPVVQYSPPPPPPPASLPPFDKIRLKRLEFKRLRQRPPRADTLNKQKHVRGTARQERGDNQRLPQGEGTPASSKDRCGKNGTLERAKGEHTGRQSPHE